MDTNQNVLRQCFNSLSIIGTLKSKEVTYGTNTSGDPTITVELVVASQDAERVNEHRVKLWAKNTSKLYSSYVTVANEYKTLDKDGHAADRVKITGQLEMNEWCSGSDMITRNSLRGVFVNRLEDDLPDEVGAVVECVITGIMDEISKDMKPTGRKKVSVLTVGYGPSIHEIQNIVVGSELASQFMQMYPVNSTGKLFFRINNYSEKVEQEEVAKPQIGFGNPLSNMPDTVVKNYINEVVIVGGDVPNVANRFTPAQIDEMKKQRELSKQEKLDKAAKTNTAPPSGFGSGFGNNTPAATAATSGFGSSFGSGFNTTPPTVENGDIPF